MLKRLINECRFTLRIETKSPLLIKEGRYDKDDFVEDRIIPRDKKEKFPNAIAVCTNTETELKSAVREQEYSRLNFYIPGTSLRGIIRSHTEMIVRTIIGDDDRPICCDPFDKKLSCSKRLEEKLRKSSEAYRYACVICKMFGSTNNRSRIQVHDGTMIQQGEINVRDGIGIDRFTGGVSDKVNFKNLVLDGYTFQSEFVIRNFELWQLGLLAYLFHDFEDEMLTLGFGKAKGFGRVKGVIIDPIQVVYFGNKKDTLLTDIGNLIPDAKDDYGFLPSNQGYGGLLELLEDKSTVSYRQNFIVKDQLEFWKTVAEVWNSAIEGKKFKPIQELVPPQKADQTDTTTEGEGENG